MVEQLWDERRTTQSLRGHYRHQRPSRTSRSSTRTLRCSLREPQRNAHRQSTRPQSEKRLDIRCSKSLLYFLPIYIYNYQFLYFFLTQKHHSHLYLLPNKNILLYPNHNNNNTNHLQMFPIHLLGLASKN